MPKPLSLFKIQVCYLEIISTQCSFELYPPACITYTHTHIVNSVHIKLKLEYSSFNMLSCVVVRLNTKTFYDSFHFICEFNCQNFLIKANALTLNTSFNTETQCLKIVMR